MCDNCGECLVRIKRNLLDRIIGVRAVYECRNCHKIKKIK